MTHAYVFPFTYEDMKTAAGIANDGVFETETPDSGGRKERRGKRREGSTQISHSDL
jgi:hypothetical protein